jgi:hypothetical protein
MSGLFGGGNQTISTSSPMLGALRVQTSAFGMAIPIIWGMTRVPANLIWYADFKAIPHTTTTSSGGGGGKGGGGGVSSSNTTYTYQTAVAMGLGEGPIYEVRRAWADKEQHTLASLGLTAFLGTYPQAPWGYVETYHPEQAIGYQGIAYVAGASYDLGDSASLRNHTFEVLARAPFDVAGGIFDANPKDILTELLTAQHFGAGFPSAKLGDLAHYSDYCVALGLFLSPALAEQKPAQEYVAELARITNAEPVWSGDVLKVIPYGDEAVTGHGVTFTPNVTPAYDLNDDHFQAPDDEDPVRVLRKTQADAFNIVQVEFLDRENQYNIDIADAKDQANIELYGERPMDVIKAHWICERATADLVAWLILQRVLYVRNEYEFELPFNFDLLEPMDLVTLTDPGLGLDMTPVRIKSIDDDASETLKIVAEEFPAGVATAARYPSQAGAGYAVDYNTAPGNVNAPTIFEPPLQLTVSSQTEIWIAVSGGVEWGGCEVWASDDDASYRRAGAIYGGARHGVLSAVLAAGDDPDAAHTLAVDLTVSRGELVSGTRDDADRLNTICYVDGEYIAYETATLTAGSKYDLTYLRRGAYGSAIVEHAAGAKFVRLDDAIFKHAVPISRVGTALYLKFVSFNKFGGGKQGLDEVPAYTYIIRGDALSSPLPNVQDLASNYVAGITRLHWGAVSDFRAPIDYEARFGPSWAGGTIYGRTPLPELPIGADGTWWIAAHYKTPEGADVYSATPSSVVVVGAKLVENVVASYDEAALGWPGSVSGSAVVFAGDLQLTGAGNYLDSPDVLAEPDIIWLGGVATSGGYTIPAGHRIDVGRVEACSVTMPYAVRGQSIYDDVLALPDVLAVTDLLGAELGSKVGVQPQIRVAQGDGVWGAWQNFQPGEYVGRYYDGRLLLTSSDPQVFPVVEGFGFAVDVPDRTDVGTSVAVPGSGASILYVAPFNGGADGDPVPVVQITVLNAQEGDTVVLSAQTLSGFTVQIKNGGVGVARNINWIAKGY